MFHTTNIVGVVLSFQLPAWLPPHRDCLCHWSPTPASSWTLTDLNSVIWLSTNWILKFYKVGNLRMIKKKKSTKTHWVINRKTNCVFRLMSMFFQYEVKFDKIVRTEKQNPFNNHSICKTCYYCKEHNFLCPSLYLNIDSRMSH